MPMVADRHIVLLLLWPSALVTPFDHSQFPLFWAYLREFTALVIPIVACRPDPSSCRSTPVGPHSSVRVPQQSQRCVRLLAFCRRAARPANHITDVSFIQV